MVTKCVLLLALFAVISTSDVRTGYWPDFENDEWHYGTFPEDFIWASATSAYQIEGGWDADGKTMSIWDTYVREAGRIADNSTGDVACNSYNLYREDVKLLKELGVKQYRLSIAWPRIFPNEDDDEPNAKGIEYYNNLLDALLAEDIEPLVTLYHWDLPQWLEEDGGWTNESLIVDAFSTFSRTCFQQFGPKVKYWLTINEPWVQAWLAYGVGIKAPGFQSPAEDPYIVGHNLILAHAEAWHIYNDEFRASQGGLIGITVNGGYGWPKDPNNPLDVAAAERLMEHDIGWFADPIFLDGHYPRDMADRVRNKSLEQGYSESRMPEFTEEQAARVKGTSDFFGLNFYTGNLVEHVDRPLFPPSYGSDKDLGESQHPSWPPSGSGWLYVVPSSIRGILNWVKNRYSNPSVFITENGVSDRNQSIHDTHRVNYLRGYINNVLKAIVLDGCNVMGYTAWSLMDNFEWEFGYLEHFGIHYVNFSSPDLTRLPKDSALYFTQVIRDNGFPRPATPPPSTTPSSSQPLASSVLFLIAIALLTCVYQIKST